MGRSSREASLLTRERLVLTARDLFQDRGYDGVGLAEIGRRAGVTRGALYHHFDNKLGVFAAVVDRLHGEIAAEVTRAAADAGPGWPGIRAGCLAFLDAAAAPTARRIVLVDAPAVLGWEHWRSLDAENSRRLLEEGLIELELAGELDPGSAQTAALMLSGAMNEAALWLAEQRSDSARDQVHLVLDSMLSALRRGSPTA